MRYVIIGNSAAAVGAIESLRKVDAGGSVTVISAEREHVYSRPLIAHYLAGDVTEDRLPYRPLGFYERYGVTPILGVEVVALDPVSRLLTLSDGRVLGYDRLLITMGSRVTLPPLKGLELEGVSTFQTYADAVRIKARLFPGVKAVVLGAGLIGIRAAYGLQEAGAEVTVVELLPRILSRVLDQPASELVRGILEAGGIRVLTGRSVVELLGGADGVTGLVLDNGEKLDCSIVVIATGVAPNIDLLKGTPVRVNRGILVNEYFQTNFSDIFAAGDVAETYDIPRGSPMVNANWPNAHEQGRYAGRCMAGQMIPYPGSLGMNSVSFYRVPVVSLGIFDPEAEGLDVCEIKIRQNLSQRIYQKLVFKDNKLKGAIFIGDLGYCGAIKDLIKDQSLVGIIKDSILEEKYQLYGFLRKKRQDKIEGRHIKWPETYVLTQRYEKNFNEESWSERERDKRAWR